MYGTLNVLFLNLGCITVKYILSKQASRICGICALDVQYISNVEVPALGFMGTSGPLKADSLVNASPPSNRCNISDQKNCL